MAQRLSVSIQKQPHDECVDHFNMTVHYDVNEETQCWEINRTQQEFATFRAILSKSTSNFTSSTFLKEDFTSHDVAQLETSFNKFLIEIGDDVWSNQTITNFLDNSKNQSMMSTLHINRLTHQVEHLNTELNSHISKFHALQTSHYFLCGIVQDILAGADYSQLSKKASSNNLKRGELLKSMYNNLTSVNTVTSGSVLGLEELGIESCIDHDSLSNRSSFHSVNTTVDMECAGTPTTTLSTAAAAAAVATTTDADAVVNIENCQNVDNTDASPVVTTAADSLSPRRPSFRTVPLTLALSSSVPDTPHFPVALQPSNAMCTYYCTSVDRILDAVRPNTTTAEFRHSVITMLRKQTRLCLSANAFPTGLHDILCSLPDDPISLTVVVGKPFLNSWHVCLTDRLNLIQERLTTSGNQEMIYADEEDMLINLPDDFHHSLRHEISNVSHTKLNLSFLVRCQIDSCEVEILANSRQDVCMLAFLEEVAALVGQDDLFKRSLLLIRAWWFYETSAYVGTQIRHYLNDFSMCVMVCAVFNQHHTRIQSPLQALCLFLAEYSAYDGAVHAITLQGIVPFKSSTSSQPVLLDAQPCHLINCEMIEKHWMLFNLSSASADSNEYETLMRSCSSDDYHQDESGSGIQGASIVVGLRPENVPVLERSAPGGIEKVSMKNLSSHNLHYFERHLFNIVHPFNHTNMVVDKLSSRRQMRLHKAFQIGATEITVYLKQSIENANNSGDLLHYFPNILARFNNISRGGGNPAEPKPPIAPIDLACYSTGEKLHSNIMYCNMMLESVVSEPALLSLSTEILAVKGPLPVGEIGKLLAETTSIGNLSQKLKEKFGGLKKFLEKFTNVFVISNDHPFNPNVLLRNSLSPEHLDLIDRGIFPHQLLQKTKKATTPSVKKKKSNSFTGSMLGLDSSSASGQGSPGSPYTGQQQQGQGQQLGLGHKMMLGAGLSINTNLGASGGGGGAGVGGNMAAQLMHGASKYGSKAPSSPITASKSIKYPPSYGSYAGPSGGMTSSYTGQQQQSSNGGYAAYQQMSQTRSTPPPPPPQHNISPHILYGHAGAHHSAQYPQQPGAQGHLGLPTGGYLPHSHSLAAGGQFNRPFGRDTDLSDPSVGFNLDNAQSYRTSNQPGSNRASISSQSSLGYYDDILSGPGLDSPPMGLSGSHRLAINTNSLSLSNIRAAVGQEMVLGSASEDVVGRQRLHSTGSIYGGNNSSSSSTGAIPGIDTHGSHSPFQQSFRSPMSPKAAQQQAQQQHQAQQQLSPNHVLYGQQPSQPSSSQAYGGFGIGTAGDDASNSRISSVNNDSFLRDFSKF